MPSTPVNNETGAPPPLLDVRRLKVYFEQRGGLLQRVTGYVKSVDDISFTVRSGETLGIVGESGCGKSTTARALLRLIEPTAGEVLFEGKDLAKLGREAMRRKRRNIQMVFQDPYAALNPRMTVRDIIAEPLSAYGLADKQDAEHRVNEMLNVCGLSPQDGGKYPHAFSGGQRQRIGIARALMVKPKLIIADEPVSALDVSIRSQILNLLQDLQEQFQLTYVFISHDLSVIRHISTRVAVMYLGRLVEIGPVEQVFRSPQHPYTKALLSAVPVPNPLIRRERILLTGDVPSPVHPPAGCAFAERCPIAADVCRTARPELPAAQGEHLAACHFAG